MLGASRLACDLTPMNLLFFLLLLGAGAAVVAAWRLSVLRRRTDQARIEREKAELAAMLAARKLTTAAAAPDAARPASVAGSARARAERVIAAEAARRQAAIKKAQNVARVEAERRAEEAARAAALLEKTLPLGPRALPPVLQPDVPATSPAPEAPVIARAPLDAAQAPVAPVAPTVTPAPLAAPPAPVDVPTPAVDLAPAAGPESPAVPVVALAPFAAPAQPAAGPAVKTAAQTLVMVVDDSKMVRVKTSRLLAAQQFQVVTAVDGLDALKQLETCDPDLVITDVDMPEMDGFGLASALRGNPETAHIPLVMITSAEDRHRDDAQRAGVGLLLGKPYPEDELLEHIRSFRFSAEGKKKLGALEPA